MFFSISKLDSLKFDFNSASSVTVARMEDGLMGDRDRGIFCVVNRQLLVALDRRPCRQS